MAMQFKDIQHLYLRGGFGATPSQIAYRTGKERTDLVEELFAASRSYRGLNHLEDPVKGKKVGNLRILFMLLRSQDQMRELNLEWIRLMAGTNAALREKMTFFWHDHFATSTPLAWLMQVQNNTLRKHALGNFRTMLHAISKDPAMIVYLNNQQNKKDHPNENFAREVMELFSLGIGHYTEQDVKEAARAFTGWTVNKKGEYEFDEKEHDEGEKTVLGRTGNWNGNDIIDMLLEDRQTARYVCEKIYRFFIGEQVDRSWLDELSDQFYNSNYDISKLMRSIFLDDRFYSRDVQGSLIASPVELIVRYKRLISLETKNDNDTLKLQKVLGQVLFFPPNVAGWPGGRNWIDASSLRLRMDLPRTIMEGGAFDLRPKPDFEDAPIAEGQSKTDKKASVRSDWNTLLRYFRKTKREELTKKVLDTFIQSDYDERLVALIDKWVDHSSADKQIISTCAAVFSIPEFQLI
ncbi:MAG: DUF1800 domain-containing protein [Chitinophagales bacterium]